MAYSNTRYLEACLGWRGLLIEGHPSNFALLNKTRPRALSLASAVCPQHGSALFSRRPGPSTGIVKHMSSQHRMRFRHDASPNHTFSVPCGPLQDWLTLLRFEAIDFFSLDVEGAELLVLSTLDWKRIRIGVLIAECASAGCIGPKDQKIANVLEPNGLHHIATLRVRHDIFNAVFVNASWKGGWALCPFAGASWCTADHAVGRDCPFAGASCQSVSWRELV